MRTLRCAAVKVKQEERNMAERFFKALAAICGYDVEITLKEPEKETDEQEGADE